MGSNINSLAAVSSPVSDALRAIRRFVRALHKADATTERLTGLSSAQLVVLQLLAESEADSVNDLAERTMTDQSSVSTVVTRLEAKRLVVRTPSRQDARRSTVRITESGRALLKTSAQTTLQERLVEVMRSRSPKDLRILACELNEIIVAMGEPHEPHNFFFEDDRNIRVR
jgi:DNA-binding MarR family transcriptional regulator